MRLTYLIPRALVPGDKQALATRGLLGIMVILPCFAVWGAVQSYGNSQALRHSAGFSEDMDHVRFLLAEEQTAEESYRLSPGPGTLARHQKVADSLRGELAAAALSAHADDAPQMLKVAARHEIYLQAATRMFSALDAGDFVLADRIDRQEVDPTFDTLQPALSRIAEEHRVEATERIHALIDLQFWLLVATPVVVMVGLALAAIFWRILSRAQQRSRESVTREAEALRASERRFRSIVQNASDLILVCGRGGDIRYRVPGEESQWPWVRSDPAAGALQALIHRDDREVFAGLWDRLALGAAPHARGKAQWTEMRLRDGADWRHVELTGSSSLDDPAVAGIVVTIRDVTERKSFETQLLHRAFYDALTGLPNRALFHDRLDQALARVQRAGGHVALVYIDLDNFKLVNDSLGHQMGDELLVRTAHRLRAVMRAQDTVARLSGDEFVVIAEGLSEVDDARTLARAIHEQFRAPFRLVDRDLLVTASIGAAVSEPDQSADVLIRNADVAMYRAKADGRGRFVVFDASMRTDSLAQLDLENDLRQAVEDEALHVHYQPIVDMKSGRIIEVEALARWQSPRRGEVPPTIFIPIAEQTGVIVKLGQWVLEQACRQIADAGLRDAGGRPLTLSVNISPRQFAAPGLIDDVRAALAASGLPATALKLEITEGIIMRDVEATIERLWELKRLGIKLAVDDFGTGYSSLSYLKRLPLDVLKIDRSFINGIGRNPEDAAIVRAILAMAKSLSLAVTSEGVEMPAQAELLTSWGCDLGQGHLFSRAVSLGDLRRLCAEQMAPAPQE